MLLSPLRKNLRRSFASLRAQLPAYAPCGALSYLHILCSYTLLFERVVRLAAHAPAPFGVVVPHTDFVVNRRILFAPVQDPARVCAFAKRAALAVNAQRIVMGIAPERSPDRVVGGGGVATRLGCVACEAEAPRLDHDLV